MDLAINHVMECFSEAIKQVIIFQHVVFLDVFEYFESLIDGKSNLQTILSSRSTLVIF